MLPEEVIDNRLTVCDNGEVNGILIGGLSTGPGAEVVVCYPGDRHLISFAPTRSGKGACHVIPNLLLYKGSTFTIDVKGENFLATQRQRRAYGSVHAFAPYDRRIPSCRINPMDFVRKGTINEVDDARTLANLLIEPSGSDKDKFWEEYARSLLVGLILYKLYDAPTTQKTLSGIVALLSLPIEGLEEHIRLMQRHRVGAVAAAGANLAGLTEDMFRNVLASVYPQMACWAPGSPVEALTSVSDIAFDSLRDRPTSFFLIIPPERIRENRGLLRVLCGVAIRSLARTWAKPGDRRILFILDEFANLGRMEDVEDGVTYLAGNGIQLWMIVQDYSQLKTIYKEKADTIFANCGARVAFSIQDIETAKKVSEMIGNKTVLVEAPTQSSGGFLAAGTMSSGHSLIARPLMTPDELMRLDRNRQIVFLDEHRPILAEKWFYFQRPEFKALFDDPRPLLSAASLPLLPRARYVSGLGGGSPQPALPPPSAARQPMPPEPVPAATGRPARAMPNGQTKYPPASGSGPVTRPVGGIPGRPPRRSPPKT